MADHKNKKQNETVDAGLCGNEKIEEASPVPTIDFQSFDWSIKDGELGEKIAS